jgi:hypothetical protein
MNAFEALEYIWDNIGEIIEFNYAPLNEEIDTVFIKCKYNMFDELVFVSKRLGDSWEDCENDLYPIIAIGENFKILKEEKND